MESLNREIERLKEEEMSFLDFVKNSLGQAVDNGTDISKIDDHDTENLAKQFDTLSKGNPDIEDAKDAKKETADAITAAKVEGAMSDTSGGDKDKLEAAQNEINKTYDKYTEQHTGRFRRHF